MIFLVSLNFFIKWTFLDEVPFLPFNIKGKVNFFDNRIAPDKDFGKKFLKKVNCFFVKNFGLNIYH